MKKITITGAGFAALSALRNLPPLDTDTGIALIAPKAELVSAHIAGGQSHV